MNETKSLSPLRTIKYLKDYSPPDYWVESLDLVFELDAQSTRVHARMVLTKNPHKQSAPLRLDGDSLTLISIHLDGKPLPDHCYSVDEKQLTLYKIPEKCVLELTTQIYPEQNSSLEGCFQSGPILCTQCEAEGFRKITYYLDRPDVMTLFTTRLVADKDRYPQLLANGNLIDSGLTKDRKHFAVWEDPYRKPSYLFALVAGDLFCHQDTFITQSGRTIDLALYVEPENASKCNHAMNALKNAMRWDEDQFGREYDLDIYMIVAVNDFNMGAMENKGLNLFNAKYVLANGQTATDQDFRNIESVVAHEYFHNWTGNRITCRDWFQLSLKEGLTVFRDQLFSADTTSELTQRIRDVRIIQNHQFAEDSGPTSHPVQPDSYMEINNFYTLTIYDKGAEVVRMIHTLLGKEGFRRGMDLYFKTYDGQAVTVEAFIGCMEKSSSKDLTQFRLWYKQAGTPVVTVTSLYDDSEKTLTLNISQQCSDTPGQSSKQPFHIPLSMGLLDPTGKPCPLMLQGENLKNAPTSRILEITKAEQNFVFTHLDHKPIPSLFRNFSAPIRLKSDTTSEMLAFLWEKDTDHFNRWHAGQTLASNLLLTLASDYQNKHTYSDIVPFVEIFSTILKSDQLDSATVALMLTLPTQSALLEQMDSADPHAIHTATTYLNHKIAEKLHPLLMQTYTKLQNPHPYRYDPILAGDRALKNLCLNLLVGLKRPEFFKVAQKQFETANNMTDSQAALISLVHNGGEQADDALILFEDRWKTDPLVMDTWFSIQATIPQEDSLQRVIGLMKHPLFSLKNPNRMRALIGNFCKSNPVAFHQPSGKGYTFLVDQLLILDQLNPQVAARLVTALSGFRKYTPNLQQKMQAALQRISRANTLSEDMYEMVSKSLGG